MRISLQNISDIPESIFGVDVSPTSDCDSSSWLLTEIAEDPSKGLVRLQEFGMFAEEFKRIGGLWIMKPVGRCQGRGIFMLDRLAQAASWKKTNDERDNDKKEIYVVSKYIERPLLVGGKKFDLRIYVLVLSYSPLKVYLHRGGFARFSAVRYTIDKESMKDLHVHLTNVAIQKKVSC